MPAPPRPSIYNLQRFLLGTLPPAEAASVAAWVESSPDAARALAAVAAHDALTKAVASTVGVRLPPAPLVARVVGNVTGSYVPAAESVPDVNERTRPADPAAARPDAADAPPERVGSFRVVRELGRGGMGVVYEAVEDALGRSAAVKVLAPDWAANPEARQRFLREARAAADLKSDHIVTVYQVGEADGLPFLAMEFIEGVTLDAWRKTRSAPVTAGDVLWAARDLLAGLAVAHKKGRVHRDIKPANAMIERATGRIKILDFGLTRGAGEGEMLTSVGRVLGTPAFMSPEQATGRAVEAPSDLFSVGATLHALVTGRSPFARDALFTTMQAVVTEEAPPLPGLPAPVGAFVARLMSKNPAARPADASAALVELRAIEARLKSPPPPPSPPRSHRTRNRVLLAVAAVLLVAAAVLFVRSGGKPETDETAGGSPGANGATAGPGSTGGGGPRLPEPLPVTADSIVTTAGDVMKGDLTEANRLTVNYGYTAQLANGRTYFVNSRTVAPYGIEVAVTLRAKQDLRVIATVVGKGRGVLLTLIDPSGKAVDGTDLRPRTADATFNEVSANGKYRLLVASDRVGDVFLQLTDPAEAGEVGTLEEKLSRMKRELAEAEANLKALKSP